MRRSTETFFEQAARIGFNIDAITAATGLAAAPAAAALATATWNSWACLESEQDGMDTKRDRLARDLTNAQEDDVLRVATAIEIYCDMPDVIWNSSPSDRNMIRCIAGLMCKVMARQRRASAAQGRGNVVPLRASA